MSSQLIQKTSSNLSAGYQGKEKSVNLISQRKDIDERISIDETGFFKSLKRITHRVLFVASLSRDLRDADLSLKLSTKKDLSFFAIESQNDLFLDIFLVHMESTLPLFFVIANNTRGRGKRVYKVLSGDKL